MKTKPAQFGPEGPCPCTMGRTEIPPEDRIPPICPRCKKETSDPHPEDGLCPKCELEWIKESTVLLTANGGW